MQLSLPFALSSHTAVVAVASEVTGNRKVEEFRILFQVNKFLALQPNESRI
jgi:hypothetical protein